MEYLVHALLIIGFLIVLGVVIWMVSDVWENLGPGGCVVVGFICLLLSPILPLVLLAYILLRQKFYGTAPPGERAEKVNEWTWRASRAEEGSRLERLPQISAAESDERIDILLAEGKREEAMRLAKESFDIAQSFGDISGTVRYQKYMDYIQRGGGKAGK